jgi:hypothetical protein
MGSTTEAPPSDEACAAWIDNNTTANTTKIVENREPSKIKMKAHRPPLSISVHP